ncbi:protein NRT1/ PTR FAMILY 5.5 isoform X2 [Spinacia oleracea]|uniref:Protein NRT1/ PTR FAMILY 5.5 isoform X2 n=1 Tax=Spinacia oleracea TaxID=3562 RepID=A0A9R0ICA8_SPIOL|nr:protein NRT1/ PTR FAMILY 5.5-like isoform X2 [Spinacia oleracea]
MLQSIRPSIKMLVTATVMAQVIMYGSYTMWLMMPYLTEVWDMSIVQAAAVINIFDGIVAILPLSFKIILDSLPNPIIADYWMLLWCGISSTIGLLLVTMSTPPVLSKAIGTCNEYESKCISHTQRSLFYVGLALLATGMATCLTSLRPYIFERAKMMNIKKPQHIWNIRQALVQNVPKETLLQQLVEAKSCVDPATLRNIAYSWPTEFWLYRCNGVFTVLLVVLVFWVMPWSFRLGIPVIILFLATLLFVSKPWYHVQGVLIISSSEPHGKTEKNSSTNTLKTKTIVKTLVCNFPIWSTFVICGLVSSVGNTYFIEQAGQMDAKLGQWEVPTAFFLLFYKLVNLFTTSLCQKSFNSKKSKWITIFAMGVSVLCCLIAALVENKRLEVVKSDNNNSVSLSMFLMVPQFFLLGVLDGAYNCCVFAFFQERSPKSVKKYLNSLMHFVLGLGILGNVVSVYVAGKVSSRGGRQSWFQHTLNKSRLDKYYWMLAVLSGINLGFYLLVALCYSKFIKKSESESQPESENEEDVEELEFKRLDWFDLLPLRQ